MGQPAAARRVDFFVSYAGPDRPWAEWAAQQLERTGYSVELAAWDWVAGDNFVRRMDDALRRSDRILALYSPAYFAPERFTGDEWSAVLAEPPDEHGRRRLVPVRVTDVQPPPILRAVVFRDVFGLPEQQARQALLEAVNGAARPTGDVTFPGAGPLPSQSAGGMRVPGSLPALWNVRRRNPAFTGREIELAGLRERLCSGDRASVQALHGIGGVGKTELAIEYAHLFANEYDLVWWIDAERPELIGEQLTALGVAARWITMDASATAAALAAAVLSRLQQTPGWLLIYDNAEAVDSVATMIPDGTGHVVVTSRRRQTGGVASPVEVDVLLRPASVLLVREIDPQLSSGDADRLAAAVEDLPLALSQAAGFLADTGMTVTEYLRELALDPVAVLTEGPTGQYRQSLASVIAATMRHLAGRDEAAVQLMHLIAILAPEPVPLRWLAEAPEGALPQPLAAAAAKPLALRRALGRVAALGLAQADAEVLRVHRLTQAVIAGQTSAAEAECADRMLAAAAPSDERNPAVWPRWADLLPHLLVRVPLTESPDLRLTAARALFYLARRGEFRTAEPLVRSWYRQWRDEFGPDDRTVLMAAQQLASTLLLLGEGEQARRLHQDTLARRQRLLGPDHRDTLTSANNLGADLFQAGEYQLARRLDEDTLARRRRLLGPDHSDTLTSANNLANDLQQLGDHERARQLNEDTLARRRRLSGPDHPDTLTSANNLAADLYRLGEYQEAVRLHEDTLRRRRRLLGPDHPDTLTSANNLGADLYKLGKYQLARELHEDTLNRRQKVLGPDHPDTLGTADNLVNDLQRLGDFDLARELREDIVKQRRRPGR